MTDDVDWEARKVENTLAAIDLQRIYLKAESTAWAPKVLEMAERLGSKDRVISGYSNLCLLILSAVHTDVGVDPMEFLHQIEIRVNEL